MTAVLLAVVLTAESPGWSFAAMPTFNYASDTGLGLGARVKAERLVEGVTPYGVGLEAQAYFSTGGTQLHFVSVDVPSLAGSAWRVDALVGFSRNVAAHAFGLGDPAPGVDTVFRQTTGLLRVRARRAFSTDTSDPLARLSAQFGYRGFVERLEVPKGSALELAAPP
jgi:hypothetical protein